MHAVYVVSVYLHVLAAVTWSGGMAFLVFVVVPLLRKGDRARAAEFLRVSGARFRTVGWTCFALLAITGSVNLYFRGVRPRDLVDADWLSSPSGAAIAAKLAVFACILAASVAHDFFLGPRAAVVGAREPGSLRAEQMRRLASALGRATAVLALAAIALGVIIVRGWP